MLLKKINNPLSKKILFSILLTSSLLTFIFTAAQLHLDYSTQMNSLEKNIQQVESTYLPSLSNSLWVFDEKQINILLNSMISINHIEKAEVVSFDTQMNFLSGDSGNFNYPIEKKIPIVYKIPEGKTLKLGHLKIFAQKDSIISNVMRKSLLILLTQFVKTFLVSLFILFFIFQLVIKPLESTRLYLDGLSLQDEMSKLDLDETLLKSQGQENEFHNIQNSINEMVERINDDIQLRDSVLLEKAHSSKLQAIGVLSSGVAHDFNNILQGLTNINYLNLKLNNDQQVQENIHKSLKFIDRGKQLVEEMLQFSRNKKPVFEVVDIADSIEEVITLGKVHRFGNVKISMQSEIETAWIQSSKLLLYQVFTNIIANSCDAIIGENEESGEVVIQLTSDDSSYIISIKDNGPGIDPEIKHKIFDPFYTTKDIGKGTGLGLSIVYGIIQDLSGEIELFSELGVGTEFIITLPKFTEEDLALMPAIDPEGSEAGNTEVLVNEKIVCLVDDEEEILSINRTFLEDEGYNVRSFSCPNKFLNYFRSHYRDVSLVLTDLAMPEVSGLELAEAVKSIKEDTPIYLVSGYIDSSIDMQLFKGYLNKPVPPSAIIDIVKNENSLLQ